VLDETIEDQLINFNFIAAASGNGHWILSAYGGNVRDKNSDQVETTSKYSVKDATVRRADQKVFHTLKCPIKRNERGDGIGRNKPLKKGNDQVVYVLVFSLQRGEEN
jgi:hypothetical protein